VFEQMGSFHPAEPHWYLPMIGVDVPFQNRGYGSALLRHALAVCDRDGVPAYLESSNPRNVPLYQRHGFELMGVIQAGSSPKLFPMVRKPRS
jgi:ribosomal protein S18 acetylase RimI-like enzyme